MWSVAERRDTEDMCSNYRFLEENEKKEWGCRRDVTHYKPELKGLVHIKKEHLTSSTFPQITPNPVAPGTQKEMFSRMSWLLFSIQ